MDTSEPRYRFEIDAHSLDDEFEALILREYGVSVADASGAPWAVEFEGTKEGIRKMVKENWGADMELDDSHFWLASKSVS